ncbi:MAG TPA: hypothetical protein VFY17_10040 [Pilimelia sp.]|nr:hypothetical protein [Pilimelia sp.]
MVAREVEFGIVRRAVVRAPEGSADHAAAPVYVCEAGRGGGKTHLLASLASYAVGRAPFSHLDLAGLDESTRPSVSSLLTAIALQLGRRWGPLEPLRFPRFYLGILATELDLNSGSDADRRDAVSELLRRRRGPATGRRLLTSLVGDAVSLIVGGGQQTTETLVDIAMDTIGNRMRRHTVARDWWAAHRREYAADPVAALVELNQSVHERSRPNGLPEAHASLLAALLADLAEAYGTGPYAAARRTNCLVLLDNADSEIGLEFLHEVVGRIRPGQPGLRAADPLVLVVASRGSVLGRLSPAERRETVMALTGAAPASAPGPAGYRWASRLLPPFTQSHVRQLLDLAQSREPGAAHATRDERANLAQLVHGLGCGHPLATRALLTQLAPAIRDHLAHGAVLEPEELLAEPGPGSEAALAAQVFHGVPADVRELLVTCSPARSPRAAAALLRAVGVPFPHRGVPYPVDWWHPADGLAVTLPRLLAQRELARRRDHPWDWSAVHRTLAAEDDRAARLHHLLAAEEVSTVARALAAALPGSDAADPAPCRSAEEWLDLLDAVTAAPHRLGRPFAVRPGAAAEPRADDDPVRLVHDLVRLEWTVRAPTCGTARTALYWRLAGAYWRLLDHFRHDCPAVAERFERYEHLAGRWRRPSAAGRPAEE